MFLNDYLFKNLFRHKNIKRKELILLCTYLALELNNKNIEEFSQINNF